MKKYELTFHELTKLGVIQAHISSHDQGFPFLVWVGEVKKEFLPKLKRMANKEIKRLQTETQ